VPGEHLLIVDDEDNLRSMLAAALRHHGFEVSAVATGREALAALPDSAPDLVVLDVMLPDVDGFEVCRRMRAGGDRTPVLFLTARDSTEDKVRGLTLGGDDYLHKPFSLEELVARVGAVLRRTGRAREDRTVLACGDLTMDDDADLHGPIVVLGDEDRLRQVLANVVGNALVHTPAGVPVDLAVTAAGDEARITVTDHGPGMTPEVAARVTERFYRADPARARGRGGSGLGLAIADAAIAAHGGTIDVRSAPGVGTTVTITLPLARHSERTHG
jgi:signal transduction histidine kinase